MLLEDRIFVTVSSMEIALFMSYFAHWLKVNELLVVTMRSVLTTRSRRDYSQVRSRHLV
jgi:hypothetical protein